MLMNLCCMEKVVDEFASSDCEFVDEQLFSKEEATFHGCFENCMLVEFYADKAVVWHTS